MTKKKGIIAGSAALAAIGAAIGTYFFLKSEKGEKFKKDVSDKYSSAVSKIRKK